jgi:hypothetical protein
MILLSVGNYEVPSSNSLQSLLLKKYPKFINVDINDSHESVLLASVLGSWEPFSLVKHFYSHILMNIDLEDNEEKLYGKKYMNSFLYYE